MRVISVSLNGRLQEQAIQKRRFVLFLTVLAYVVMATSFTACSSSVAPEITVGTHNIATQQFSIDPSKGNVVVGAQGAIFAIPSGAFLDAMGNEVKTPVSLRIKEANRDVDILVGGLITQAGDDLLASGGMYMIEAFSEGKALKLNPDVGIYASLPTSKKDKLMGLYKGAFNESKLDWKLTGQGESSIPMCNRDKASRAMCKKCERLAKMAKKIKPGKKPNRETEYWAKRHVWENGKLYFYSSGSRQQVLSQEQLDECKDYLAASEKGQDLLALVDEYKAEWKDRVGEYYSYKLNDLGWFNIDKVVKEDMITFTGRVVDQDGNPVRGANVHLYCKDPDLKVHTLTTAEDGTYKMQFAKSRQVFLYAYEKGRLGKQTVNLTSDGQSLSDIALAQIDHEHASGFLSELL